MSATMLDASTHSSLTLESLTVANARTALEQGIAAIRSGQTVFDLSRLTTVDSAAVAVLLAWQRAARKAGATLAYVKLPANLLSLAKLYGVDAFLADPAPVHAATPAAAHHHH
jgi:phospholipid transport system transporter-binding protein